MSNPNDNMNDIYVILNQIKNAYDTKKINNEQYNNIIKTFKDVLNLVINNSEQPISGGFLNQLMTGGSNDTEDTDDTITSLNYDGENSLDISLKGGYDYLYNSSKKKKFTPTASYHKNKPVSNNELSDQIKNDTESLTGGQLNNYFNKLIESTLKNKKVKGGDFEEDEFDGGTKKRKACKKKKSMKGSGIEENQETTKGEYPKDENGLVIVKPAKNEPIKQEIGRKVSKVYPEDENGLVIVNSAKNEQKKDGKVALVDEEQDEKEIQEQIEKEEQEQSGGKDIDEDDEDDIDIDDDKDDKDEDEDDIDIDDDENDDEIFEGGKSQLQPYHDKIVENITKYLDKYETDLEGEQKIIKGKQIKRLLNVLYYKSDENTTMEDRIKQLEDIADKSSTEAKLKKIITNNKDELDSIIDSWVKTEPKKKNKKKSKKSKVFSDKESIEIKKNSSSIKDSENTETSIDGGIVNTASMIDSVIMGGKKSSLKRNLFNY